MLILGISLFKYDTAAALMRDGVFVAGVENNKLDPRSQLLPEAAIRFCLERENVSWSDVDCVAISNDPLRGWSRRALSGCYFSPLSPRSWLYHEGKEIARYAREHTRIQALRQRKKTGSFVVCDHHLCHASSAFFLSPFEQALILTLDGEGDGRAGMVATGRGNRIDALKSISLSDSVGRVYSRITTMLGFAASREEHKTQWLSLEGSPVYKEFMLRIMRPAGQHQPRVDYRYFRRDMNGAFRPSEQFWREIGLNGNIAELALPDRQNLASSIQAAVTELVSDLLTELQEKTASQRICLGGGLFHNSVLVAALEKKFGTGNIFVPPAPGNAGCALGAAAWVWHQQQNKPRGPEMRSVYWGPAYSRGEIKEVLDNVKARYAIQNTDEQKFESAIRLLHSGKIIGWFRGATEFGPRALGHRSILASPWAPYITENLNDFVKHRESFRPFAVSVRAEDCERYFVGSPLCRLMNSVASVRPGSNILPVELQLPGGLVRLHILEKEADPILWELLRRFGEKAPAPILVNTSFNLPGEPPVVRPKDAVRTFFCSGIDALFLDHFLLTKSSAAHVLHATSEESPSIPVRF